MDRVCSHWPHGMQARLAQSVERKALNLVVVGSSPTVGVFARRAKFTQPLYSCHLAKEDTSQNEGREIRTPNLLIWSQTRCRCAIPPERRALGCGRGGAKPKQEKARTPKRGGCAWAASAPPPPFLSRSFCHAGFPWKARSLWRTSIACWPSMALSLRGAATLLGRAAPVAVAWLSRPLFSQALGFEFPLRPPRLWHTEAACPVARGCVAA